MARIDADLASVSHLDDQAAADALNALPGEPTLGDAPILDIQNVLLLAGDWGKIKVAAHGSDAIAVLAENALALFESPEVAAIGFGDSPTVLPAITGMLDLLVTATLVSADSRAAILAMAYRPTLKYDPSVTSREVGLARGSK